MRGAQGCNNARENKYTTVSDYMSSVWKHYYLWGGGGGGKQMYLYKINYKIRPGITFRCGVIDGDDVLTHLRRAV